MKRNIRIITGMLTAAFLCAACSPSEEQQVSECAEDFSRAYFNMDFSGAAGYCTPESRKWLEFKTSNITSSEIEAHNTCNRKLQVSVEEVKVRNDTSADVRCLVTNAVTTDSLEANEAHVTARQTWRIPLVKRAGKWHVKMEAPLQSAE